MARRLDPDPAWQDNFRSFLLPFFHGSNMCSGGANEGPKGISKHIRDTSYIQTTQNRFSIHACEIIKQTILI